MRCGAGTWRASAPNSHRMQSERMGGDGFADSRGQRRCRPCPDEVENVADRIDGFELEITVFTERQFAAKLIDVLLDRTARDPSFLAPHRARNLLAREERAR